METDLNWCLTGCGKKSQLGSVYCSSSCFRTAISSNSNSFNSTTGFELLKFRCRLNEYHKRKVS
ncbi:hypothetical protein BC833DRAFT_612585 [Globomyces pollinis-pini]|nr:hypothetical protein BC833DRAFT_612585 [Globomyces pollinis-pini]